MKIALTIRNLTDYFQKENQVIDLTKELIETETDESESLAARNSKNAKATLNLNHPIPWKMGDRCMAIWRVDAK